MAKRFIDGQEVTGSAFLEAVGTVSESSGVPTGAIIESGSNANGDYIKYADGTLIMHAFKKATVVLAGGNGEIRWTYPIESVTDVTVLPPVNANASTSNTASIYLTAQHYYSNEKVNARFWCWSLSGAKPASGTTLYFNFFAIGRWY